MGFSLGYLGGGVLFGLNVWMLQDFAFFGFKDETEAIKASFVSVAIWWGVFSLPLLLFVKESRDKTKTKRVTVFGGRRQKYN